MRLALPLLLVLSLATVLWFALRPSAPPVAPPKTVSEPTPVAAAHLEPAPLVEPGTPLDASSARVTVPAAKEPAPAAATEPELAEVRGRFLFESGAPAGGVAIRLRGWEGNQQRAMKFGTPKAWSDPTTTSAADGTFSLRLDPPRAYQFVLEGKLAGHVEASWRWHEIPPAKMRDVGDVVLHAGGTIAGRVVDAAGKPIAADWMLYADGPPRAGVEGAEPARVMAQADRMTGAFRLEDVPAGSVRLKAHLRIVNWVEGPSVDVRAGETTNADVVYSGPDFTTQVTVITFARPFHIYDSQVNAIVLSAPGFEPRTAKKLERSSQSFVFEDVPPGAYTVSIDDPKFLPWSKEGVAPGTSVDARLKGGAAVRLAVVDATTRAPMERYGVRVRFHESNWSPNEFELLALGATPPAGGQFEGLIVDAQTLIVRAEGYADTTVVLTDLARGEARSIVVELSRGTELVALVTEADDTTPAPGLEVVLAKEGADVSRGRFRDAGELRKATTGPDGRARFDSVQAGTYVLSTARTSLLRTRAEGVVVAAADATKEVRLALPAHGLLAGKVLAPSGAVFDDLYVEVEPIELDEETRDDLRFSSLDRGRGSRDAGALGTDGAFRTGPLPPGRARVQLKLPMVTSPTRNGSSGTDAGMRAIGEVEIVAGRETHVELDARAVFPGRVRVRASLDGAPAGSAVVEFAGVDGTAGVAVLDADGAGRSGPLFPGRMRATVRDLDATWSWTAPGELDVRPGATIDVAWTIALAKGELVLVDAATGAPFAARALWIELDGEDGTRSNATTNAEGKIGLRLAPGRYWIHLPPKMDAPGRFTPARDRVASFDWSDRGGPAEPVRVEAAQPR